MNIILALGLVALAYGLDHECDLIDNVRYTRSLIATSPPPAQAFVLKNKINIQATDANIRYYYNDWLSLKLQDREVRHALRETAEMFIVISQFYLAKSLIKREEMLASLQMNLLSPFVYEIHLLQEDDEATDLILSSVAFASQKLRISVINKRMTIADAVHYANTLDQRPRPNAQERIVAVANVDNLFTSFTLANLGDLTRPEWRNTFFLLSRTNSFQDKSRSHSEKIIYDDQNLCFDSGPGISSDVFMFIPPMDYYHTRTNLSLMLGTLHMEQYIVAQILSNMPGWGVANLCTAAELYHNHRYRQKNTGVTIVDEQLKKRNPFYSRFAHPRSSTWESTVPVRETNATANCIRQKSPVKLKKNKYRLGG